MECNDEVMVRLYEGTYKEVCLLLKSLLRKKSQVLDVVEIVYDEAFRRLSQLEDEDDFLDWIKDIAIKKAVEEVKKNPSNKDEQRLVVGLYDDANKSIEQIASILDVSEKRAQDILNKDKKPLLLVGMVIILILLSLFNNRSSPYQPILDEYAMAINGSWNSEFINVNEVMLHHYNLYGEDESFYYTYYDIDKNGSEELLIGYGKDTKTFVDVYCIKNDQPHKLIDEYSLGERSQLYIYPDGTMLLSGSAGVFYNTITTYTFNEDGCSLKEEIENYEGQFDLIAALSNKANNQVEINNTNNKHSLILDWKPLI